MRDGNPLVSVVIPAYNAESTVAETVDALRQQTLTDWELVFIDDGSSDKTAKIVAGYADSRIHVTVLEHNMGHPEARNEGFKRARGKYIVIMDADDVSFPERIERQVSYLESHKDVDGCGSGHVILTSCPLFDRFKAWLRKTHSRFISSSEVACETLWGGKVYNPTMCFKRELLDTIPVWFDPDFRSGSDDIFYNRLIAAGARLVILPDVLLRYRRLRNSNSRRFKTAAWDNRARTALEAVHRLIPETTPEQEQLHTLVVHRDSSLAPEHLAGIMGWFSFLFERNREKQLFDDEALLRCMGYYWERACAIAGCRDLKTALSAYENFPLLRSHAPSRLAFLYEWQKRKFGKKRGGR